MGSQATLPALLSLLLGLTACGSATPRPARIVLVTIDTLRADHVGCYGAGEATTPTLDGLARRGVRFETAIAPTPLTLPSHATLLTGLDPPEHGVRANGLFRLADELPMLQERMRDAGYATAAFVSAFVLERRFGLARGFEHYDDTLGVVDSAEPGVSARPADQTADAALAWLETAPERFFLWLHLYDPHAIYAPPEPHRTRHLGRPYDGEIAFADAELGRLLAGIDARFPDGGTLVLVTADHGESLGEHGEPTHAFSVYDATQRIPLLMAGPGLPQGVVAPALARLADVAPTLLELAGGAALPDTSGASLLPLLRGEAAPGPRVAWVETLATQFDFGWSPLFGVRTAEHKYVRAPRPELYALRDDPGETKNLASEQPELAAELDALVEPQVAGRRVEPNLGIDAESREQLQALGYVAESRPFAGGRALGQVGGADPKDEIGKLETMREALTLLHAGRPAEALEKLDALGEVGLDLELVRGSAALAAGAFDAAHASVARTRALAPDGPWSYTLEARVAEAEGELERAEALFGQALRVGSDVESGVGVARVVEGQGRIDEARALYERAAGASQVGAECLWRLAALEIERGQRERAHALLARVPQRLARAPEAAARLALAERASGRPDLARLRLAGALRTHPGASPLLLVEGELLEDDDKLAAALDARRRAQQATPREPATKLALARSLALSGQDLDLALALATDALAPRRRSPQALATLALVRLARRDFAHALALADEGLALSPAGPVEAELRFRRAEALAGLGRPDAARETLGQALQLAPPGPRAQQASARVARLLEPQPG